MFAPHHQPAADELVRVCRPAGPSAAELDAGGLHRPDVRGDEAVRRRRPRPGPRRRRCGAARTTCATCSATGSPTSSPAAERCEVDRFTTAAEFRDYFKANYGPTIAVYRYIADDPERGRGAGRRPWPNWASGTLGDGVMEWEYLLVTATRA